MLGIFETSIVKSRFQHEASMASEIEECTTKTWFQNLVMFTYELGKTFFIFYDVFELFCVKGRVHQPQSIKSFTIHFMMCLE